MEVFMKKTFQTVLSPSAVALVSLCACVSPLSDVNIDDFSIIGANMTINKYFGTSSAAWQNVHAFVYDKNSAAVRIKNGGVSVNNMAMVYDSTILARCYTRDNLALTKNSDYRFVITISNSDTCTSIVRTPPAEFGIVTVPTSFHLSQGATVTWSDVALGSPIDIKLSIYSTKDSATHTIVDNAGVLDSGKFAIPQIDTTLVGNATLELTRRTTGTVSAKLRGGTVGTKYMFSAGMSAVK
jgi:hypothetical protein